MSRDCPFPALVHAPTLEPEGTAAHARRMLGQFLHLVLCFGLVLSLGCEGSTEQPAAKQAPAAGASEATSAQNQEKTASKFEADLVEASHSPEKGASDDNSLPGYPSFADLVEASRPAVINIFTKTRRRVRQPQNPFVPFAPRERVSESLGSGFLIDPNGLALTNHHVIQNATEIEVRLLDDRRFRATIVGQDPKTDVALIQLEGASDLPYLKMADSKNLRVGDWVIAIGNPLGLTSTVTAGIASATGRRDVPLNGEMVYQDFIQTDASINPGNSGGPLLDIKGRVVGINTAISSEGQGIGFAIPINMVQEILPQLKETGKVKRSWLGIYVDEVPGALSKQLALAPGGALIKGVVPKGPADLAKLREGDVIIKLDGTSINDASHLTWVAGHLGIGKVVDVELQRGNQRMMTRMKLGALPD